MDAALVALGEGATVVTANDRLARGVKLAYNRLQLLRGDHTWRTPDVIPWRAWLGRLWSVSRAGDGVAGRRSLLGDPECRVLWHEIVRDADACMLPGTVSPVAELAGRAWELSQGWRVTPADLMAAADSDNSRTFASLAGAYVERCQARSWADPGMLVPWLATDCRSGKLPSCRIDLVGFDDWTPLQRELLRVMAGSGWAVIEHGAQPVSGTTARRIGCRDDAQELELAARWTRRIVEAGGAQRVGIVVPHLAARISRARRSVLDVLAPEWRLRPPLELPANFSQGETLAHVGLIHAALIALRALAGELEHDEAGQLLRSPYIRGNALEACQRAELDLWARERIGTSVRISGLAARAAEIAPMLSGQLRALLAVAGTTQRRQHPTGWARTFADALRAVGWPGDGPVASDEYQAGGAWQDRIEELCRCDRITGAVDLEAALNLLSGLVRNQVFQPAGHPDAVQVLGTLEAIGQRFDALWICGLTSEEWPPMARPDPLVPLTLQRELRMPNSSPGLVRERAERMIRLLAASAPDVVVSYPEHSGDEPLSPSPLIAHWPACVSSDLRLWEEPHWRSAMAAGRANEVLVSDPPPPVEPPGSLRGGAALIERQARCPARAFLEFRLGARELRGSIAGIDARTRGAIVHGVLHDFFSEIADHAQLLRLTMEDEAALLDSIILRQLENRLPVRDRVVHRMARHEHTRLRRLMGEFLRRERQRAAFSVSCVECALAPAAAPASISALGLTVRPDRVDELPGGGQLVIEYKTGRLLPPLSELWGPRPRSPQLPLYASLTAAQGVALVQLTSSRIHYLVIGEDSLQVADIVTPAELTGGSAASWQELRAQWQAALERIAAEILAGDFRVDRRRRQEAEGQWAMATRIHELPDDDEGSA